MDLKSLGSTIANNAPKLGALLGSVVPGLGTVTGGALGMGIKAIASAFGLKDDAKPEEIIQAIQSDPNAALKLRQAEIDFQIQQGAQKLQELEAYISDVQNARQREIEITESTGKKDYNLYILAWTVIVGFFFLCWYLMNQKLPEGSNEVVFMLFGALASGFGIVLQYFFGSSKSSSDKTNLLASKETKK